MIGPETTIGKSCRLETGFAKEEAMARDQDKKGAEAPIGAPIGTVTCPICEKPALDAYRPFCSKRCADLDLGRWFSGNYRIHTEERPGEEGEED